MGFSLIGAAVVLGLTLFMAVEIITGDLLPTIESINDSYDDMNERFQEQVHTNINITAVSRSANGSKFVPEPPEWLPGYSGQKGPVGVNYARDDS